MCKYICAIMIENNGPGFDVSNYLEVNRNTFVEVVVMVRIIRVRGRRKRRKRNTCSIPDTIVESKITITV